MKMRYGKKTACTMAERYESSLLSGSHLNQSLWPCGSVTFLTGVCQDPSAHRDIIYGLEIGKLIKIAHYF